MAVSEQKIFIVPLLNSQCSNYISYFSLDNAWGQITQTKLITHTQGLLVPNI